MLICTTAFMPLATKQAKALGRADLPIVVMPHPFSTLSSDQVRSTAAQCVASIIELMQGEGAIAQPSTGEAASAKVAQDTRIALLDVEDDLIAVNRVFRDQFWGDGLPIVPPTVERVQQMLRGSPRPAQDVVAILPPGFGAATVELLAINAVMAGCDPGSLPVLIAAVEAAAAPEFNLQAIQATTNSAGVWLIVNGPIAAELGMNAGINCLGNGNWANATLGRALRLVMQNAGGAVPGEMDRATQGQPGKYTFCCAENEEASPWEPLHVERGHTREQSTVTVVGASGTINMNTHVKDADLLRIIADSMVYPSSNDYWFGGAPWLILSPEHAEVLDKAGLSKQGVKEALWKQSRMQVTRFSAVDRTRSQNVRRKELGEYRDDSLIPISPMPADIGIIVAGGPGTHSVYVPSFGATRAVTRVID